MRRNRIAALGMGLLALGSFCLLTGCEGINYKHDPRVVDISPPPENGPGRGADTSLETYNFPDLVEQMMATRETYIAAREQYIVRLRELERACLTLGDTARAGWARRQRELIEKAEPITYPYLTAEAPEHRVEVAPEESIPEADAIYARAKALLNEIRGVPLAGHLEHNKRKAREALALFKQVLRDHPRSDKVDDCAFYCGEIYKEYLREDDPDDELALRYYRWAYTLDPQTPHAARFQAAVVYDFRRHNRDKAIELYHQVIELEENNNLSNQRFAAARIEQLTDDDRSPLRPQLASPTPPPATEVPVVSDRTGDPVRPPLADADREPVNVEEP